MAKAQPIYKFGILVAAAVSVVLLTGCGKPRTYGDLAKEEAQRCVDRNGYGDWVGSSGISLQEFCDRIGMLKAGAQLRRDHPERF